jgi:DNA-binding NarL/FixJ family response regulator
MRPTPGKPALRQNPPHRSWGRALRLPGQGRGIPEAKMVVRVFLVDDLKSMQELVGGLLESVGGFEIVGRANSETSATNWLLRNQGGWDLAIVDLMLGEGTGFTLVSRCNKEPGGAVLVFSDFATPAVRKRCLRLGADGVISKAEFGELRAYLRAFPGRMPERAVA